MRNKLPFRRYNPGTPPPFDYAGALEQKVEDFFTAQRSDDVDAVSSSWTNLYHWTRAFHHYNPGQKESLQHLWRAITYAAETGDNFLRDIRESQVGSTLGKLITPDEVYRTYYERLPSGADAFSQHKREVHSQVEAEYAERMAEVIVLEDHRAAG